MPSGCLCICCISLFMLFLISSYFFLLLPNPQGNLTSKGEISRHTMNRGKRPQHICSTLFLSTEAFRMTTFHETRVWYSHSLYERISECPHTKANIKNIASKYHWWQMANEKWLSLVAIFSLILPEQHKICRTRQRKLNCFPTPVWWWKFCRVEGGLNNDDSPLPDVRLQSVE